MNLIDVDSIEYEPMLVAKGNGDYEEVMIAHKDQIDTMPIINYEDLKFLSNGTLKSTRIITFLLFKFIFSILFIVHPYNFIFLQNYYNIIYIFKQ